MKILNIFVKFSKKKIEINNKLLNEKIESVNKTSEEKH